MRPFENPIRTPARLRNLDMLCANPDIIVQFGDKMIWCAGAVARDYAALGGKVIMAGPQGGYGNYTCIQHTSSLSTCYAHQSSFAVSVGAPVLASQLA